MEKDLKLIPYLLADSGHRKPFVGSVSFNTSSGLNDMVNGNRMRGRLGLDFDHATNNEISNSNFGNHHRMKIKINSRSRSFFIEGSNHVMGIHVSPPRVISYHPTAKDSTKIPLKGSRLGNIHSAKYERLTNVVI